MHESNYPWNTDTEHTGATQSESTNVAPVYGDHMSGKTLFLSFWMLFWSSDYFCHVQTQMNRTELDFPKAYSLHATIDSTAGVTQFLKADVHFRSIWFNLLRLVKPVPAVL